LLRGDTVTDVLERTVGRIKPPMVSTTTTTAAPAAASSRRRPSRAAS